MGDSAPKAGGHAKREMAWRDRLCRHAASGLGVAAFCEYESISTASFYRWRAVLAGKANALADGIAKAAFIDLGGMRPNDAAVPGAVNEPAFLDVSLDLGHGMVLRIVRR